MDTTKELEAAYAAITSYYTLSSVDQLAPDKTQNELQAETLNEEVAAKELEKMEAAIEAHQAEKQLRQRVTRNGKKENA